MYLVVRSDSFHGGQGFNATNDPAEDGVLPIQMLARAVSDETETKRESLFISWMTKLGFCCVSQSVYSKIANKQKVLP
jgi:hypothetical protein